MTLVVMLLVIMVFTIGFYLARMKKFEAHRWVQTSAATLNMIFVLWMMILPFRDFILKDTGGPRPAYFYLVTTMHAIFGSLALLFGLFVVLRGNNLAPRPLRFSNYKLFMRVAYGLYLFATIAGVVVYLTWFVIVPNPPLFE